MPSLKLLLSLSLVLVALPAWGDSSVLRGIGRGPFKITVETLDKEARATGLNESSLEKIVRTKLQKQGLTVGTICDAELYVRLVVITSYGTGGNVLGYGSNVELEVRERSALRRDPTLLFMATTWSKATIVVANREQFVKDTALGLGRLTDQFLLDFGRENPATPRKK